MVTHEEYVKAIDELIEISNRNNTNLKYIKDEKDMKRASELKSIMYAYEYQNKESIEPKKSIIKRLFKK